MSISSRFLTFSNIREPQRPFDRYCRRSRWLFRKKIRFSSVGPPGTPGPRPTLGALDKNQGEIRWIFDPKWVNHFTAFFYDWIRWNFEKMILTSLLLIVCRNDDTQVHRMFIADIWEILKYAGIRVVKTFFFIGFPDDRVRWRVEKHHAQLGRHRFKMKINSEILKWSSKRTERRTKLEL